MRFRGTQSWQVSWGDGGIARTALYLRDALSLPAAPEIPPLIPAVAAADGVDRAAVAAQWPGWWADVLAFLSGGPDDPRERHLLLPVRPDSPALAARPAIRAALDVLGPLAARHPRPRRPQRRDIAGIVRAREAKLGRPARPFRLVVTELSVDGLVMHRVSDRHLLVSTRFAEDEPRCRAALTEIIAELA
jgi:hypothetical protein